MEPTAPLTAHRSSKITTAVVVTAIVIGVMLRAIEMSHGRPLWLDEAMLSLNIASKSFGQLVRPLDYDQSAPLLYLWLERLVVSIAGVSERSLRAIPFVAGVLLVPGTWLVMRRLVGATAAALATVLVALSVTLISFSAEAKQYGTDPLATLIALWFTARVMASPSDNRRWMELGLAGVGTLLLSQPAVFVLGGVVLALAVAARARNANSLRNLAAVTAVWACVFAILYVTVYRATAQNGYMRHFWEGTFLSPYAPDFLGRLELFTFAAFTAPFLSGAALGNGVAIALVWLLAVVLLWRRSHALATLLAAPLILAAGACAVGSYAVMDRLFLFAAPLTLTAVAVVVAELTERVHVERRTYALLATCAAIAAIVAPTLIRRIRQPVFYAVGTQIIADIDSMSKGDAVYVAARSFPLWIYYTTDWTAPDVDRLKWAASIGGAGAPAHNNAPSRGGRVQAYEATRLARRYRGRMEIVGLPTGRQYVSSTRSLDPSIPASEQAIPAQSDSGWARLEVSRMAAVARPRLWVFGSHMFALDSAEPELVAELQARRVNLLMERRQGTTVGYQVEFPAEP
jgi:hypothetical protein